MVEKNDLVQHQLSHRLPLRRNTPSFRPRLAQKIQPEFTTTYSYNADGLMESVVSTNQTSKIYTYDDFLRLYKEKETVPIGKWLEKTYTLSGGQLVSTKYASQFETIVTENYYYTLGHLSEVKLNGTTSIWRLNAVNAFGQPTSATTGSFTRTYGYNNVGFPITRTAGSFQNFSYGFDVAKGNLISRTDNTRAIQEQFSFDNLDRLSGFSGDTAQYNNLGNLLEKSDVGTFTYGNTNAPYQVTAASTINSSIPMRNRSVTYTSFKRPASITEGVYSANFVYNANNEQVKRTMWKNGTIFSHYMSDCYEVDLKSTTGYKQKLYLNGDYYTSSAVYVKEGNGSWQIYYICRDYLGSITHITSSTGAVVQELSYDAWGRLRDPSTQVVYTPGNEPELFLGRGYSGHEHLTCFGLINMNARLYDPVVGRFLSPDPYVQSPDFSQNFNRYSYCLNNPLKYSDPSGEFIFTALLAPIGLAPLGVIIDGACWSAAIDAGIQGIRIASGAQDKFNWSELGGAAVGGAVFAGMGLIAPSFSVTSTSLITNLPKYAGKAGWAALAGAASTGAGMLGSDMFDNGQLDYSGEEYLKAMGTAGLSSGGLSFAGSMIDYATWDRLSTTAKIDKLNAKYNADIRYNASLNAKGGYTRGNTYVEIGPAGLTSKGQAFYTASHEVYHMNTWLKYGANIRIPAGLTLTTQREITAHKFSMRKFSTSYELWVDRYDLLRGRGAYSGNGYGYKGFVFSFGLDQMWNFFY